MLKVRKACAILCYLHKVLENADLTIVIERRLGFVWEWEAGHGRRKG